MSIGQSMNCHSLSVLISKIGYNISVLYYKIVNYIRQYAKLIETRLNRPLVPGVYYEKHHIIPKCVRESKAVVSLTYREHIIAHHLLYKAFARSFGPEHGCTTKLRYALVAMVNFKNKSRKVFTDRGIAVLIKRHSGKANLKRKPHTKKTKQLISKARAGKGIGKQCSKQTRQKISRSKIGIARPNSVKFKLSDSTKYLWSNRGSGAVEISTAYELETKYSLNRSNLCAVKNGKRPACGGWAPVCIVIDKVVDQVILWPSS